MNQNKILFLVGTHGDEQGPIRALEELKKGYLKDKFDVLVANEKAVEQEVRFIDTDLNRVYPGIENSSLHEEKLACKNLKQAKGYQYVFDLHIASSSKIDFLISPSKEIKNHSLLKFINIEKLILWPSSSNRQTGPISQFLDSSIEIEFGSSGKTNNELLKHIEGTVEELIVSIDKGTFQYHNKKAYLVYGKLDVSDYDDEVILTDFEEINIGEENFYPLLTNQYLTKGIKCYKMHLI